MQRLGQHFLKNISVVKKIVDAIAIEESDTIIEIGPGHGELTRSLHEACEKIGATLIAVEKDEKLASGLSVKNIKIIHDDALNFLKDPTFLSSHDIRRCKLVGNIPYYITGHLLRILSEMEKKPALCVFMVQKEVAERICAEPPDMNRLAASVQFWASPKIVARVPRTDFAPAPEVDSAVIKLGGAVRDEKISEASYYAAVRALFAQPRKTILNNLAAGLNKETETAEVGRGPMESKEKISALLLKLEVGPELRPQNLTISNVVAVARAFF